MVVEEVAQTVFGVNMPGLVVVVEEVAQTVFGLNMHKHTNCYIEV